METSPLTASSSPSAPPSCPIVALASGKGGVGKTWLAITLAHAWSRAGLRVLLCDGDLGLANIDVQLGLNPAGDLGAVVSGRLSLAAAATRHPAGFTLLPGVSGSGALSALPAGALATLLRGLRALGRGHDRVVLDLGAGLDPGLRRMAAFADRLLVVVTDEPTSLTDAYAVLKTYAADCRAGGVRGCATIVVNQAASVADGQRTYRALARACTQFLGGAPSLAGVIRRDPQVRVAIRRQAPLLEIAPGCAAASDAVALAELLSADN